MSHFSLVARMVGCMVVFGVSLVNAQEQRLPMNELVLEEGRFIRSSDGEPYSGDVISVFATDETKTRELGTLRDGRWHGIYETYYFNGQLESKISYSNGEFDGPLERYYFDGQVIARGTYDKGDRCGEWFDVDGTEDSYPPCPGSSG